MRMMILSDKMYNGYAIQQLCTIDKRERGAVLEFKSIARTENNKWNVCNVVSDIYFNRCALTNEEMLELGLDSENLIKSISEKYRESGNEFLAKVTDFAKCKTECSIELPYRTKPAFKERDARAVVNTFYPVKVTFEGRDVSRFFEDFEIFGSDVAYSAYSAMVGKFNFKRLPSDDLSQRDNLKSLRQLIKDREEIYVGRPTRFGFVYNREEELV